MNDTKTKPVPTLRRLRQRQRQQLLKEMLVSRMPYRHYATYFKVSIPTIERDVAEIRRELRSEIATTSSVDIVASLKSDFDWAAREFQRLYASANTAPPVERASLITGFIRTRVEFTKAMQSLGVYQQTAQKVQVQHVMFDRIDALDPKLKKELLSCRDEKAFLEKLAQLVGSDLASAALGVKGPLLLGASEDEVVDEEVLHDE